MQHIIQTIHWKINRIFERLWFHLKQFVCNPYQENTYVLYDDKGFCAIIDPGMYGKAEEDLFLSFIEEHKLNPVLLLNTHCHIDHVLGNKFIHEHYGLLPQFHEGELPLLIEGISPRGVLKYQQGFDDLVITPIDFARDALGEYDKVSAIEMYTRQPEKLAEIEKQIQDKLGKDFKVLNREEQNPTLYKTVSTEKWGSILYSYFRYHAIIQYYGSMTMTGHCKRQDMIIEKSGAENILIQRIFYNEGIYVALIEDTFGFIRTGEGNNSIIDAYPVDIRLSDFLLVFLTVLLASVLISYLSSLLSVKAIGDLKAESSE
ncbi:hypothetical protein FQR65_LT16441 [Abscondita terminalis]|nr:hypothetical protein FQR65_LT16441 [Abscondita terminalis]